MTGGRSRIKARAGLDLCPDNAGEDRPPAIFRGNVADWHDRWQRDPEIGYR